jgi:methylase of polypeptide subunit release factors
MQRCLSAIAAATPAGSSVVELYAGCGVIGLALAAQVRNDVLFPEPWQRRAGLVVATL